MSRPSKEETLMAVARIFAKRSTCSRLRVGAVLADPSLETFVVGYNGSFKGGPNECQRSDAGNCGCLHAEANAVAKAERGPKVAFLTDAPCELCAKLLVNADVTTLRYEREYRESSGLKVLRAANIQVFRHEEESSTLGRLPYRCSVCDGRGSVPVGHYLLDGFAIDNSRMCKVCGGSGLVWSVE